jgi:hypothetical protein
MGTLCVLFLLPENGSCCISLHTQQRTAEGRKTEHTAAVSVLACGCCLPEQCAFLHQSQERNRGALCADTDTAAAKMQERVSEVLSLCQVLALCALAAGALTCRY